MSRWRVHDEWEFRGKWTPAPMPQQRARRLLRLRKADGAAWNRLLQGDGDHGNGDGARDALQFSLKGLTGIQHQFVLVSCDRGFATYHCWLFYLWS